MDHRLFRRHEELAFISGWWWTPSLALFEDTTVVKRVGSLLIRRLGRRCVNVVRVDVCLTQARSMNENEI